jgi:uncharacterized protein (DUF779 family)
MTQDDIIWLAKKSGIAKHGLGWTCWEGQLERFAQLVAEHEREHYDSLFEHIKGWCDAYPISVFPEPDFKKAHEVLKANGMTLDSISASNMKHVIMQVQKMIEDTIRARGNNG